MDINDNELENVNIDGAICMDVNETNNNLNIPRELSKAALGDVESSHSDGSKTIESREDRIKRLKEHSEAERQRKLAEIMESQKQSNELRQRQQIERRRKIEELKFREEERRRGVEQRRRELDEKEKEKTETLQKRNKEREARAALCQQKPLSRGGPGIPGSMSQSMISPRQARQLMTTSVNSSSTSSGGCGGSSDKCMKQAGYGRWPSSCDVDRLVVGPPSPSPLPTHAAGTAANHGRRCRATRSASHHAGGPRKLLQPPEGFLEVDGHFIPASTRHAGCFLPFKGPRYHVRGVLSWGPPRTAVSAAAVCAGPGPTSGGSVAWWASAGDGRQGKASRRRRQQQQQRARSAHDSLVDGSHGGTATGTGTDCMRDTQSARIKNNRSASRNNVATSATATPANAKAAAAATATNRHRDDSLFDRLSKPRSGSQPPKSASKEPSDSASIAATKLMSTSFTKKSARGDHHTVTGTTTVSGSSKRKPLDGAKSDTGAAIGQEDQAPPVVVIGPPATNQDTDTPSDTSGNTAPTATAPEDSRKHSKQHQASRSPPDNADTTGGQVPLGEEVAYKMKLAEQRRIAREKKEEQLGEQRRIEEDARQRAALEKKRFEEETRTLIEEEAKRARLEEDERLAEIERQRVADEADKKKRDEEQREMEEQRLEKLRLAEEERMDRKRRLEKIMSRVKPSDKSSGSPPIDDNAPPATTTTTAAAPGVTEAMAGGDDATTETAISTDDVSLEEEEHVLDEQIELSAGGDSSAGVAVKDDSPQPTEAWPSEQLEPDTRRPDEPQLGHDGSRSDSPDQLSEAVLNLSGPDQDSHSSQSLPTPLPLSADSNPVPGGDQAPQFKSRLLQSMLGKGRLNAATRGSPDEQQRAANLTERADKRSSLCLSRDNAGDSLDSGGDGDGDECRQPVLPHSKSFHSDLSQHAVSNGSSAISASAHLARNSDINGLSPECVPVANGNGGDRHVPVQAPASAQPSGDWHNGTGPPSHSNSSIVHSGGIANSGGGSTINCSVTISDSNSDTNIDPPTRMALDLLELRSESACSPLSSDDCCPPPMVNALPPLRSHALELS